MIEKRQRQSEEEDSKEKEEYEQYVKGEQGADEARLRRERARRLKQVNSEIAHHSKLAPQMHTRSSWALLREGEGDKENNAAAINVNDVDKSLDKSLELGDLRNLNQSKTVSFYEDRTNDEHGASRADGLPDEIHDAAQTPDLADESVLFAKFLQGSTATGYASQNKSKLKNSSWMQGALQESNGQTDGGYAKLLDTQNLVSSSFFIP